MRHWGEPPSSLKRTADRAFCEGINRFVIHCTTATRPEDGKPGYEYGAGTHFNPNVTWWDKSGALLAYFGRCQHLLQEGRFVADVLYYNGDWAPNRVQPKHVDPSLGPGYDYDACNAEALLTRLSIQDGRITLPDGMSYRLLVLPDSKRMAVAGEDVSDFALGNDHQGHLVDSVLPPPVEQVEAAAEHLGLVAGFAVQGNQMPLLDRAVGAPEFFDDAHATVGDESKAHERRPDPDGSHGSRKVGQYPQGDNLSVTHRKLLSSNHQRSFRQRPGQLRRCS